MKKIVQLLLIVLLFNACDDGFEELNENPNAATSLEPQPKLTATILRVSGDRYEDWRANLIYASTMIQHIATTAGYWSGDKYSYNAQYSGAWFERTYNDQVKGIEDLRTQLSAEDSPYPEEMLSVVRILRVFIYSKVSDIYGDVPYSEAGKAFTDNIFRPRYDEQSEIYADMLNELAEATAALDGGTSQFGSSDIIFGGDLGKWERWGNSLMLRLALRMVKVDPAAAQEWASRAIEGGVMNSNDDIAYVQHTDGPEGINRNGNGQAFTADNNPRLSDTFINFLQDDPRLVIYGSLPDVEANANTDRFAPENQRGLPNGLDARTLPIETGEESLDRFTEPNRNIITSEAAPMFFQTYAEVEFMLAESALRWGLAGGDAE
ncbi:MAG: SusD/RagB family nutrient-binding outer membrane lipoprotein, partial [Leeuwenhoekiella sp.]